MKKNELIKIKVLDLKELRTKAKNIKDEIANLVMDKNMKKLKDVKKIAKTKRDLAQVMTIIRQKEMLDELEMKKGES